MIELDIEHTQVPSVQPRHEAPSRLRPPQRSRVAGAKNYNYNTKYNTNTYITKYTPPSGVFSFPARFAHSYSNVFLLLAAFGCRPSATRSAADPTVERQVGHRQQLTAGVLKYIAQIRCWHTVGHVLARGARACGHGPPYVRGAGRAQHFAAPPRAQPAAYPQLPQPP
jgi:hypothetical protein